jgi:hypothetical protein
MAIACLRLVTFLPERPERSVPRLRFRMARSTFWAAFAPYFLRPISFWSLLWILLEGSSWQVPSRRQLHGIAV